LSRKTPHITVGDGNTAYLPYPIGTDDYYKTWDAFGSRAWPSHYLIDRQGQIRAARIAHIGNAERLVPGKILSFKKPARIARHTFAFFGSWRINDEYAVAEAAEAGVLLHFDANKANLVLVPPVGEEVIAEVLIDGEPATDANRGVDVSLENGKAFCRIREARMYNFVKTDYGAHVLEIRLNRAGLKAYAFTFG
jgi:hypothetical protein